MPVGVESGIQKHGATESIKFTVSQNEPVKGQNVTLKCRIHKMDLLDFIRIIRKNKGIRPVRVSTNQVITKTLNNTGRYKGHFKRDGKSAQVTLQITGISLLTTLRKYTTITYLI